MNIFSTELLKSYTQFSLRWVMLLAKQIEQATESYINHDKVAAQPATR